MAFRGNSRTDLYVSTPGAFLIGVFSGVAGLIAAYYLDTGVGAAVVLCAALCYAVTLLFRRRVR